MKIFILGTFCILLLTPLAQSKCVYYYDHKSSKLEWTAYKTTSKVPVKGSFGQVRVTRKKTAKNVQELIKSFDVTVQTPSVDSGDKGRDNTLMKHFFDIAFPNKRIRGTVETVNDKKFVVYFESGKSSFTLPFTYEVKNLKLTAKSTMNILEAGYKKALGALSKACFDLHKGSDGKSKTWSDVDITITTTLKTQC